jgi:hypothetical protein
MQPHSASDRTNAAAAARTYKIRLSKLGRRYLFFYFNSTPESHISFDLTGSRLRVGIVPSRIGIILPVNVQTHISRLPLPRTGRGRAARSEVLSIQTVFREIDIPFNHFGRLALGYDLAVPNRFCHFSFAPRLSPDPDLRRTEVFRTITDIGRGNETNGFHRSGR